VGEGEFYYEPMKGKTVLGSHLKVSRPLAPGQCIGVIVCSSQSAKNIGSAGNFIDDRKFNVAQLFRGTSTREELSRAPADAAQRVVFNTPRLDGEVGVSLDGIMLDSYDCHIMRAPDRRHANNMHLPRIVESSFMGDSCIESKNFTMLGDRKNHSQFLSHESQAAINASFRRWMRRPLFCKDGSDYYRRV